ncbi:2-hydroxy-3-keto-5-methylthiopentenyl-1-phosphate phosphatase [Paenibacillus sp. LMG 31458]|uniref:2-hydroxy-3-keto-5-methylthiopentenyl-1-phosphate phosphatase n=1 Tax=Paenibacillus phytorum TaxID=2654977 RepID=A0ABX1XW57_9BACL|nr:2-hydroxy-3-keto-5-methylthiopentenyl-1-phosphate phosphatase [Paenibacillus phytorum]NOU72023.1 2-hydroxy-3-keto-5-methylthiopentenyl-1-phosphate phosphatase [Paenibacillus phytorum]
MSKERIIFCDFDGTITVNDNIVAIMKHFNPAGWEAIVEQILDKTISIRQGVGEMFALLPTSRKDEIVEYAINNAVIRDGFKEFVDYCKEQNIKLLITSGGIDFFIYPLLKPFAIPSEHIYCNASTFEGNAIEILWPNHCDEHCKTDCGMCKTSIIRSYDANQYERIIIGDSITDFEGAKLVDTIFARSHLIDMCKQLDYPYHSFETFFDIMKQLEAEPVV